MSADTIVVTLELVGGQRDGQQITGYEVGLEPGAGLPPEVRASAVVEGAPIIVDEVDPLEPLVSGVVVYRPSASGIRDVLRALSIPESMRPRGLVVRYLLDGMHA